MSTQSNQESSHPLADAARALARRWWIPVLAGLVCAAAAGGIDALRPALYESRAVVRVSLESELAALGTTLAASIQAFTPPAKRREVYQYAESVVRLMGNRILDKDQAFSQYMTSYTVNTFARVARADATLLTFAAQMGKGLEKSWPGALDDLDILRERAIRVERSKPDNIITLEFRARDPQTARRGADTLAKVLIGRAESLRRDQHQALVADAKRQVEAARKTVEERRAKIEQAEKAAGAGSVDPSRASRSDDELDRVALDSAKQFYRDALEYEQQISSTALFESEPAMELLENSSNAARVSPTPMATAARAGLGGFLLALLLIASLGCGSKES